MQIECINWQAIGTSMGGKKREEDGNAGKCYHSSSCH